MQRIYFIVKTFATWHLQKAESWDLSGILKKPKKLDNGTAVGP